MIDTKLKIDAEVLSSETVIVFRRLQQHKYCKSCDKVMTLSIYSDLLSASIIKLRTSILKLVHIFQHLKQHYKLKR